MVPSEKERVTFYLRKDMIKELDEFAKSMHMNRSQFLEWLFETSLPYVKPVANLVKEPHKFLEKMKKEGEPG